MSLGLKTKLRIGIQGALLVVFLGLQAWISQAFIDQVLHSAERRASAVADDLIAAWMTMTASQSLSDPAQRRLLLKGMESSEGIRELRIVRGRGTTDQFGPGVPEEAPRDDLDREVLRRGIVRTRIAENGERLDALRFELPFIASRNFRGTDCLACHRVAEGTVLGAASITIDLAEDRRAIDRIKLMLWLAQGGLQILLFFVIGRLVRYLLRPLDQAKSLMYRMQTSGDLSKRMRIRSEDEIGQAAKAFNRMMASLEEFRRLNVQLATTDSLTGVSNRRRFEELLQREIDDAAISGSRLGLIILDVDHFKQINDTFGHRAGDQVLRELTACMSRNTRRQDLIGRWGGEEFVILAPGCDAAAVQAFAEKLRQVVERHSFDSVGRVTCTFGVAEWQCGEALESFFQRADEALYAAKRSGRNRVEAACAPAA